MKWNRDGNTAWLKVGVIQVIVFGSPDRNPKSYTWQLNVVTARFAAGSEPNMETAILRAEDALKASVSKIVVDMTALS